jgi:Arc/MetJ-type ribon-helix-helix transcriptional regulator
MTEILEYEKKSVSMPRTVVVDVQERVGSREFSAYVTGAVQRQLQRDALNDIIARMEAKHGPVDEAAVAAITERMSA